MIGIMDMPVSLLQDAAQLPDTMRRIEVGDETDRIAARNRERLIEVQPTPELEDTFRLGMKRLQTQERHASVRQSQRWTRIGRPLNEIWTKAVHDQTAVFRKRNQPVELPPRHRFHRALGNYIAKRMDVFGARHPRCQAWSRTRIERIQRKPTRTARCRRVW